MSRLAAALLLFPVLALTAGTFASHEGHGCHFEKDCLACRWAADTVADAAAPTAIPPPVEAVEDLWSAPSVRLVDALPETASSRGPPPA